MCPFVKPVLDNTFLVVCVFLVAFNLTMLIQMLQYWKERDWTWWVSVSFSAFYVLFTTPFIIFKIYKVLNSTP